MAVGWTFVQRHLVCERVFQRLHKISVVSSEIFQSHDAALARDEIDDRLGHSPLVVACFAMFSDASERLRQCWKLDDLSRARRTAVHEHLIAVWRSPLEEWFIALPLIKCQARREIAEGPRLTENPVISDTGCLHS